ncbi:MAG: alpha/beta hydrolase fold domain-containing protein, partial [Clostridia bacterium]|nr:alpha/beta hydrolase fold domain-containing protein [Clostridia bacterium]
FYGRLSVGSTDVEKFRESNLPPTFYAYGTEDPFYYQFMANADAVREAGVSVEEHCYEGQPHGFGAGNEKSNWVPEFDRWLTDIYENN